MVAKTKIGKESKEFIDYARLGKDAITYLRDSTSKKGLTYICQVAAMVAANENPDCPVFNTLAWREEVLAKGKSIPEATKKQIPIWETDIAEHINGLTPDNLPQGYKSMLRQTQYVACWLNNFGSSSISMEGTGVNRKLSIVIQACFVPSAWNKLSVEEKEALPAEKIIGTGDKTTYITFNELHKIAKIAMGLTAESRDTGGATKGKSKDIAKDDVNIVEELDAAFNPAIMDKESVNYRQKIAEESALMLAAFLGRVAPGEKGFTKDFLSAMQELEIAVSTFNKIVSAPVKDAA